MQIIWSKLFWDFENPPQKLKSSRKFKIFTFLADSVFVNVFKISVPMNAAVDHVI